MAEEIEPDGLVPPAGEPIHLPEPSYLPAVVAAGTTFAVVGIVINFLIFGLGLAIALVATIRWVRQTRAEMADLPLEHEH